jgi:hypothetical protein
MFALGHKRTWRQLNALFVLPPTAAVIFAPDLLTAKKERRVLIETARFLRVSVCIKT